MSNNKIKYYLQSWRIPVQPNGYKLAVGTTNPEYKSVRSKFIAKNGHWLEVFDRKDFPANSPFEIDYITARSGTPGQLNLKVRYKENTLPPIPVPSDYFYYPLTNNFTEYVENAANLRRESTVGIGPEIVDDGQRTSARINPAHNQYLSLPNDAQGGADFFGLLGSTGQNYLLFGLQFCPVSLPATGEAFLFYGGIAGKRVYLSYNPQGDLKLAWEGDSKLELTIPGVCIANQWTGVWVKHDLNSTNKITFKTTRAVPKTSNTVPYFAPSQDAARQNCFIGRGQMPGTLAATPFFNATVLKPPLTVVSEYVLSNTTENYVSAMPGGVMSPNTGKYYIEIDIGTSFNVQLGLGQPNGNLNEAPGVIGWCVATINGTRFNHNYGGGQEWMDPVAQNSIMGLLYDSDLGSFTIYVNEFTIGKPFPDGTITEDVKFVIGGVADAGGVRPFNITARVLKASQTYPKVDTKDVPSSYVMSEGEWVYSDLKVSNFFIRNAPFSSELIQGAIIADKEDKRLFFVEDNLRPGNTQKVAHPIEEYILKKEVFSDGQEIHLYTPELPPGKYQLQMRSDTYHSVGRDFTIEELSFTTKPLSIDFRYSDLSDIDSALMTAHKQWGGINGGVIAENVILDRKAGVLKLRALGDQYTGPLRGVDTLGVTTTASNRIGGCAVTKNSYGPGSYRVRAKLPVHTGVVSAFWIFHYEEAHYGHYNYNKILNDGIHRAGTLEDGYYVVRNHEIDIEIPSALKSDTDMEVVDYRNARFNTWRGENKNWDVPESNPNYWKEYTDDFIRHDVQVNDGKFHEFRFDWHLGDNPRVEFYIDGILKHIVYDTIPDIPGRFWFGLWFPSAPGNYWAGKVAAFQEQYMEVSHLSILPFNQYTVRRIGESYPQHAFRNIFDKNPR